MKKKILLMFATIFLFVACDFETKIEEIIVPEEITVDLGEEVKLVIDYAPKEATDPEFVIEYNKDEFDVEAVDGEYIITPKLVGTFELKVIDVVSKLKKTIKIICVNDLSVEFLFAQRVEKQQAKVIDVEELIEELKDNLEITVNVNNWYFKGKYLNDDEIYEYSNETILSEVGEPKFPESPLQNFENSTKCLNERPEIKYDLRIRHSSLTEKTFNEYEANKELQEEIKYVFPDTRVPKNKPSLGDPRLEYDYNCHNFWGYDGVGYAHLIYVYPLSTTPLYSKVKDIMENFIVDACTKVYEENYPAIKDFPMEIISEDVESLKTYNGIFELKKNMNDKSYEKIIAEDWRDNYQILDTLDYFEHFQDDDESIVGINTYTTNVAVKERETTVLDPAYAVIKKIIVNWEDNVSSVTFNLLNSEEHHNINYELNSELKTLTIEIEEKDLEDDNCLLDGVLGTISYIKGSETFSKEIKVIKE